MFLCPELDGNEAFKIASDCRKIRRTKINKINAFKGEVIHLHKSIKNMDSSIVMNLYSEIS